MVALTTDYRREVDVGTGTLIIEASRSLNGNLLDLRARLQEDGREPTEFYGLDLNDDPAFVLTGPRVLQEDLLKILRGAVNSSDNRVRIDLGQALQTYDTLGQTTEPTGQQSPLVTYGPLVAASVFVDSVASSNLGIDCDVLQAISAAWSLGTFAITYRGLSKDLNTALVHLRSHENYRAGR